MVKIPAEKSKQGFTLIELIIVFGLISLLAASLALYSRKSEKLLLLFKDQVRVISALQKAKSFALGAYGQQNSPCGFGVHFNAPPQNTFVIFQDLPQPGETCVASADNVLTAGSPLEVMETLSLDKFLEFETPVLEDVVYVPPAPDAVLSGGVEDAIIGIKISGTAEAKRIKVTNFGQITPVNN